MRKWFLVIVLGLYLLAQKRLEAMPEHNTLIEMERVTAKWK